MTLEEMLALLPDNTTGAIQAADLRIIVTELYGYTELQETRWTALDPRIATLELAVTELQTGLAGQTTALEQLAARVAALEARPPVTGGGATPLPSITGVWQINPQANTVPGGKQMTTNTGLVSTASWLRFDQFDLSDTDMGQALLTAKHLFMQQKQNAENWCRLDVNGTSVDAGSYIQVPVTGFVGAGSVIPAAWQSAVVVMGFGA